MVLQIDAPGDGGGPGVRSARVAVTNATEGETITWSGELIEPLPEPYFHKTSDGQKFDGTFFGYKYQTSWAVKYHESVPEDPDSDPYWGVRLLRKGEQLLEGESSTWLRIEKI